MSLERPYGGWGSPNDLRVWELPMIRYLEEHGFWVDYAADIDLHTRPDLFLPPRQLVLTVGHDEYWSMPMRRTLEEARNRSVNLGFFGSNQAYWQVRLEPHPDGRENLTLVCYKAEGPDPEPDPALQTVRFRSPPVSYPESALLGLQYQALNRGVWDLNITARAREIFRDGPPNGSSWKGIVGHEWDAVPGPIPDHVILLAEGAPLRSNGTAGQAHTVLFRHPGGGLEFSTGTFGWLYGLEGSSTWKVPRNEELRGFTQVILRLLIGDTTVLAPGVAL